MNLLEDGEHRHRIDGRDQRREEEDVQERQVDAEDAGLTAGPQRPADGGDIEYRTDHGHQQDGANVVEEHAVRHEVARVEDDRRQHVEEERVRCQR